MGYAFSPKAAKKANAKLAVLRQTRAQRGKMTTFENKVKDEGKTQQKAEVPGNEINNKTNQAKKGTGTVSAGGGIGKAESQFRRDEIDAGRNKTTWPAGGGVKASNPKTGNTRMKGPIAKSGGPYGGGGRATQ